jgi:hypothetical protein
MAEGKHVGNFSAKIAGIAKESALEKIISKRLGGEPSSVCVAGFAGGLISLTIRACPRISPGARHPIVGYREISGCQLTKKQPPVEAV